MRIEENEQGRWLISDGNNDFIQIKSDVKFNGPILQLFWTKEGIPETMEDYCEIPKQN